MEVCKYCGKKRTSYDDDELCYSHLNVYKESDFDHRNYYPRHVWVEETEEARQMRKQNEKIFVKTSSRRNKFS